MSLSQSRLREYAKLKLKKYRTLRKQFIVEGVRGLTDVLDTPAAGRLIESVLYTSDFYTDNRHEILLRMIKDAGVQTYEVDTMTLDKLTGTVTNQNIIAIVNQWNTPIDAVLHRTEPQLIVAVDRVREPGNLGAIVRTCDWFGVDAILLGKDTVEIWNPKVVRSTVGSMVHVPFVEEVDLPVQFGTLKEAGYFIAGTDVRRGVSIADGAPVRPCVIILGSEAEGISPDILTVVDITVTIPGFGKAESLNVGVAAGVILSSIRFAEMSKEKSA
jgi:RNA methyltransferase, TrmH family